MAVSVDVLDLLLGAEPDIEPDPLIVPCSICPMAPSFRNEKKSVCLGFVALEGRGGGVVFLAGRGLYCCEDDIC